MCISHIVVTSACGEVHQWEMDLPLLSEKPEKLLAAHLVSHHAAISAREQGNQWEKAPALL